MMQSMGEDVSKIVNAGRWLRAERLARAGATHALNTVLPPRCLATGTPVAEAGQLSAAAWAEIGFLGAPQCAICGFPFEFDRGEGALCGPCTRQAPPYDWARAVMRYDGGGRDLILGFKHADRTHGAPLFGKWLGGLCTAALGSNPGVLSIIVAPVPLHRRRLLTRRYNQASMLAYAMVKDIAAHRSDFELTVIPDLLVRHRNTPVQGGHAGMREKNIRGAFGLNERYRDRLEGQRVILIDDVHTTGATLTECTRILQQGDAQAVYALTLARVVRSA